MNTVAQIALILFFVAYLATIAVALLQISRVPGLQAWSRAAWIVIIVAMPLLGAIAWFALGSRTPEAEQTLRRLWK